MLATLHSLNLTGVGVRWPLIYGTLATQPPQHAPGGWTLSVTGSGTGFKGALLRIETPSYHLRSITITNPAGRPYVARVVELTTAPRIPSPTPRC